MESTKEMRLGNRQIGAVGVAKVIAALFRNGYNALTPVEDFSGYDLVAEKNGNFFRIQVKSTQGTERNRVFYRFCTGTGCFAKKRYSASDVDYIICYALDADLYWIFKTKECSTKTKKCHPKTGSSWRIINDL